MKSKLKFYIGSPSIQTFGGANLLEKKIDGVDIDMVANGEMLSIKLILHSLADITNEVVIKVIQAKFGERRTKIEILHRSEFDGSFNYRFYDTKFKANGINTLDFDKLTPDQMAVLTDNSYDIFKWIADGKAIDSKAHYTVKN